MDKKVPKKKWVLMTISVAMTGFLCIYWWNWKRSPRAFDLVAATRGFVTPTQWTLTENIIRDRDPLCIDVRCPSIARRWETMLVPSSLELFDIANKAGWNNIQIDGDCLQFNQNSRPAQSCELTAKASKFVVTLIISGPRNLSKDEIFWINQSVEP